MDLIRRALLVLLCSGVTAAYAQAPPATVTASLTSTTCTGTPGAGTGCVVLNVSSYASASIQVTGTFVGTLAWTVSNDGSTYQAVNLTPPNSTTTATTATSTGVWAGSVAGLKYLKVAFTAYTSGTAVITLQAAAGGGGGGGGGGAASSVTINDPSVTTQKAAVNASGQLSITCANCSGSGASAVDESAFTQGVNSVAPLGVLFTNSYTSLTTGQVGIGQGTAQGSQFVNLRNASGTELGVAAAPVQISLANTAANATAVKVDGSAVTQPVSGTVTTTPPANASTNVAQVAGTTTDTNSGTKSAGTIRVVIATDQPALTNKLLVTPDSVALPANQSVNIAQINGVTPLMGAGATGTGAQRVNDVSAAATGAAPPASATYIGGLASGATGGFLTGPTVCDTHKPISMTSATTTLMVTGVSGRHVRICSLHLVTAIANNVAIISGTGATCGTGTAGMAGGTTAANGYNFAANGGIAIGSGFGEVLRTVATGDSVCIITSAAGPLAGNLAYAIY